MRYSILIPLLLVLGMGCVVHDPVYPAGGYVAYYGPTSYPVYYGDGYYWSYYNDGWYWWSRDRWVYTHSRPRYPVQLRSGPRGYHAPGNYAGVRTRDHRTPRGGYHAPSARSAPPPRWAPAPSRAVAPRTTVRDHRRR